MITSETLKKIAESVYKGYGHASVLYARKSIKNRLFYDKIVQKDIDELKKMLNVN